MTEIKSGNIRVNMGQRGKGPVVVYEATIVDSYLDWTGALWYVVEYETDDGRILRNDVHADFIE